MRARETRLPDDLWLVRIRDHYNDVAEKYRDIKQFPERILERLHPDSDQRVLDVGCGAGNFTFDLIEAFRPREVVGIDVSDRLIEQARKTKTDKGIQNVTFICGNAQELPFDNESFDVVVSNMVFHLLADQKASFLQTHRVLKHGGQCVMQFQGQRDVAPEYFQLLREAWHHVFDGRRELPVLYNITSIAEIDIWLSALGVEKSEVTWRSNAVKLNRDQFVKYLGFIPLVSGFWKHGIDGKEIDRIERVFSDKVDRHFRSHDAFKLTGNTIVVSYTK